MLRLPRRACICACVFSILITVTACTSGSTYPQEEEEPITEPFLSLSGLGGEAPLKGKVQLIVDGKASGGFPELRLFVGQEQIARLDHPTLPHKQVLETYRFANGEHQIRAEAEVAGDGATVEQSLLATFENYYMVEVDTEGYVNRYVTEYDEATILVSDPAGNLLGSAELTGRTGELIQLVPPREPNGAEAPAYLNVTLAYRDRFADMEYTSLLTYAGLSPWNLHLGGTYTAPSEVTMKKEFIVEIQNYTFDMNLVGFYTEAGLGARYFYEENRASAHLEVQESVANLITVLERNPKTTRNRLSYNWDSSIGEVTTGDTLSFDTQQDFKEMPVHRLSHARGLELLAYSFRVSVEPDSWDRGSVSVSSFIGPDYDKSDSDSELGMFVIDEGRLHRTSIAMQPQSDPGILHVQLTMGSLPAAFKTIDGEANVVGLSGRELQLQVEGQADYLQLRSSYAAENESRSWSVLLPDTLETFTYPEVSDLIDYGSLTLSLSLIHI